MPGFTVLVVRELPEDLFESHVFTGTFPMEAPVMFGVSGIPHEVADGVIRRTLRKYISVHVKASDENGGIVVACKNPEIVLDTLAGTLGLAIEAEWRYLTSRQTTPHPDKLFVALETRERHADLG